MFAEASYTWLTKSLAALEDSGGQASAAVGRADGHVTAVQAQWLGGGERRWQQLQAMHYAQSMKPFQAACISDVHRHVSDCQQEDLKMS